MDFCRRIFCSINFQSSGSGIPAAGRRAALPSIWLASVTHGSCDRRFVGAGRMDQRRRSAGRAAGGELIGRAGAHAGGAVDLPRDTRRESRGADDSVQPAIQR